MNADQMQAVNDILENLESIKGEQFSSAVRFMAIGDSFMGMIASADMNETHRAMLAERASEVLATATDQIVTLGGHDPKEILEWARKISDRVHSMIHGQ